MFFLFAPDVGDDESDMLRNVAEAMYGSAWQPKMAERLGVAKSLISMVTSSNQANRRPMSSKLRSKFRRWLDQAELEEKNAHHNRILMINAIQHKLMRLPNVTG